MDRAPEGREPVAGASPLAVSQAILNSSREQSPRRGSRRHAGRSSSRSRPGATRSSSPPAPSCTTSSSGSRPSSAPKSPTATSPRSSSEPSPKSSNGSRPGASPRQPLLARPLPARRSHTAPAPGHRATSRQPCGAPCARVTSTAAASSTSRARRCCERHRLEFHHRRPYGMGDPHSPENIGLLCPAHNRYLAEQPRSRRGGDQGAPNLAPGIIPGSLERLTAWPRPARPVSALRRRPAGGHGTALYAAQPVAQLFLLGFQVAPARVGGGDLDRDALDDREAVALDAGELRRVVGHEPQLADAEVEEDLRARAVVALVGREARARRWPRRCPCPGPAARRRVILLARPMPRPSWRR